MLVPLGATFNIAGKFAPPGVDLIFGMYYADGIFSAFKMIEQIKGTISQQVLEDFRRGNIDRATSSAGAESPSIPFTIGWAKHILGKK
jgi:hypothetical protein